jgi:hypothetical protein
MSVHHKARTDITHGGVEIDSTKHCFNPLRASNQAQFLLQGSINWGCGCFRKTVVSKHRVRSSGAQQTELP